MLKIKEINPSPRILESISLSIEGDVANHLSLKESLKAIDIGDAKVFEYDTVFQSVTLQTPNPNLDFEFYTVVRSNLICEVVKTIEQYKKENDNEH